MRLLRRAGLCAVLAIGVTGCSLVSRRSETIAVTNPCSARIQVTPYTGPRQLREPKDPQVAWNPRRFSIDPGHSTLIFQPFSDYVDDVTVPTMAPPALLAIHVEPSGVNVRVNDSDIIREATGLQYAAYALTIPDWACPASGDPGSRANDP